MKVYRVKSESDPNKFYLVKYFEETKKFICIVEGTDKLCPSYGFGKKGFECKHIKKVKKYRKGKNVRKSS